MENIKKELNLQECVFLLGRRKNPYKYIKNASILALSSYYEGTPNVIVEALGLQTPVVTTNCTDGIMELMHLKTKKPIGNIILTEGGVITPNIFKGTLEIPTIKNIASFKQEEDALFEGLNYALSNELAIRKSIASNYQALLSKFDFEQVAKEYLTN